MGVFRSRSIARTELQRVSQSPIGCGDRQTIDDLVGRRGPILFLIVLDHAMGVQSVGHRPAEFKVDADFRAVGRHHGGVYPHLVFGVAISGLSIPFVFVLAFLGRLGIKLVRVIFDRERGVFGLVRLAKASQCCPRFSRDHPTLPRFSSGEAPNLHPIWLSRGHPVRLAGCIRPVVRLTVSWLNMSYHSDQSVRPPPNRTEVSLPRTYGVQRE